VSNELDTLLTALHVDLEDRVLSGGDPWAAQRALLRELTAVVDHHHAHAAAARRAVSAGWVLMR
jgi:hypothetical protein